MSTERSVELLQGAFEASRWCRSFAASVLFFRVASLIRDCHSRLGSQASPEERQAGGLSVFL